jgi:hypothetical protein
MNNGVLENIFMGIRTKKLWILTLIIFKKTLKYKTTR